MGYLKDVNLEQWESLIDLTWTFRALKLMNGKLERTLLLMFWDYKNGP